MWIKTKYGVFEINRFKKDVTSDGRYWIDIYGDCFIKNCEFKTKKKRDEAYEKIWNTIGKDVKVDILRLEA